MKKEHVSLAAAVDDVKHLAQQCSDLCKENFAQQRAAKSRQRHSILVRVSGSVLV